MAPVQRIGVFGRVQQSILTVAAGKPGLQTIPWAAPWSCCHTTPCRERKHTGYKRVVNSQTSVTYSNNAFTRQSQSVSWNSSFLFHGAFEDGTVHWYLRWLYIVSFKFYYVFFFFLSTVNQLNLVCWTELDRSHIHVSCVNWWAQCVIDDTMFLFLSTMHPGHWFYFLSMNTPSCFPTWKNKKWNVCVCVCFPNRFHLVCPFMSVCHFHARHWFKLNCPSCSYHTRPQRHTRVH